MAKSYGTCNGESQHDGKVVTLAETYAACIEQPIHDLAWAITVAEAHPSIPFYMEVDH